jgi:flagellar hook-length control protein FliK
MQLFADMINGGAPSDSGASPLQDVTAFLLGGDQPDAVKDSTDTDSDDTDSDEAAALAMSAMLPGMMPVAPSTAPGAATAGGANAGTDGISAALASKVAIDTSQAALDGLADDSSDAAGNASTKAADSTNNAQTTAPAQMHALLASHNAAPDIDVPVDGTLRTAVGTHAWRDELGAQLTLMAVNGREAASLKLSPDHLGPLEIRISVQDGQASVYFGATNADTRSALEQSLPRLRELFAAQGMVLADAGVSRDSPRNSFKPTPFNGGSRGSSDADPVTSVTSVTLARAGLIDTYV